MTLELIIVSQRLEEALAIQYERIKDRRVRDTFVKRLESQVETLLKDSLDWDIKEPTAAQLNYALLVAKQLGDFPAQRGQEVSLPHGHVLGDLCGPSEEGP